MMPNVTRGDRTRGLLGYLAGPGRFNEHDEPHLVAGDPAIMAMYGDSVLDAVTAAAIAADMDDPMNTLGVTVPAGHVWHCSLSIKSDEGPLTDEQWQAIAQDFMDEMGFTEASGKAPARWVAVRHGVSSNGNDHIHIAANVVREDGTKVSVHNDFARAQRVAGELEMKHGLVVLESRQLGVSERGEKPGERFAAARRGDAEVGAARLERAVRAAATASVDEGEFVRRLHQYGIVVRPRFAAGRDDVVLGYSVALRPRPGERFVWHGGGRLARDLTLTRLREEWPDTIVGAKQAVDEWQATWRNPMRYQPVHPGRERESITPGVWATYQQDAARLQQQLAATDPRDRSAWARVSREASGAFAAWSQRLEPTPGPLAEASRVLARGAQIRRHQQQPPSVRGGSLASAATLLAVGTGMVSGTRADFLIFQQMQRTAKSIHDMLTAVGALNEARRIREAMGSRLDSIRAQISAPVDERRAALDTARNDAARIAAAGEATGMRPLGSPIPNRIDPQQPAPAAPTRHNPNPQKGNDHGRD